MSKFLSIAILILIPLLALSQNPQGSADLLKGLKSLKLPQIEVKKVTPPPLNMLEARRNTMISIVNDYLDRYNEEFKKLNGVTWDVVSPGTKEAWNINIMNLTPDQLRQDPETPLELLKADTRASAQKIFLMKQKEAASQKKSNLISGSGATVSDFANSKEAQQLKVELDEMKAKYDRLSIQNQEILETLKQSSKADKESPSASKNISAPTTSMDSKTLIGFGVIFVLLGLLFFDRRKKG